MVNNDRASATVEAAVPDQAFHYTSLDTMMKIVDTRTIWCTAIPYLNDSKERSFLCDAVERRLPVYKRINKSMDQNLVLSSMEVEDADRLTSFDDEVFVACFGENRDSLMHWRAYCPQQNGVAIGFQSMCLQEARLDEKLLPGMIVHPSQFGRVRYLNTENLSSLDQLISFSYDKAQYEVSQRHSWATLNEYFRWHIEKEACFLKQEAFEVEDELRLVVPSMRYRANNIRFRTVRSTLIPYIAMKIPSILNASPDFDHNKKWNAINTVVLGPSANVTLTERSVKAFFDQREMNVQVATTQIPYRDW